MYYGRKKAITIAIIASVAVIVLIVGGIIIATKTDLFKSNKTLFWKYAKTAFEKNEDLSFEHPKAFEKLKNDSPYKSNIKVSLDSSNEKLNQAFSQFNIEADCQIDRTEGYSHITPKITVNNNSLIDLDYIKYNNIYAVKSNEIVNAYLGIRNENLKVLAQKLGIQNTNIPDSLPESSYSDILDIPEENINHIKEKYLEIIANNILEKNYSKQTGAIIQKDGNSYKTTSYRVDLSSNELSMIIVKLLEYLKTDSVTMNLIISKATSLNLDEKYTSISGVQELIDEEISKIEGTQLPDVAIVVYNYKGQTISTEIIVKNKSKLTIYNEEHKITASLEDLAGESDYAKATAIMTYNINPSMSKYSLNISLDDVDYLTVGLTNSGSVSSQNMISEITMTYIYDRDNDESITLTLENETEIVDELENVVELNQNNSGILNDFTQEQLAQLMPALVNRTNEVIQQKAQAINLNGIIQAMNEKTTVPSDAQTVSEQTDANTNAQNNTSSQVSNGTGVVSDLVTTYNARFEAYKGLINGKNLKTLKILVQNNNQSADTDNIIAMTIDGTIIEDETDNSMIDTNSNYDVQMQYGPSGMITQIVAVKK